MKIQILGTGCSKCRKLLTANAEKAVKRKAAGHPAAREPAAGEAAAAFSERTARRIFIDFLLQRRPQRSCGRYRCIYNYMTHKTRGLAAAHAAARGRDPRRPGYRSVMCIPSFPATLRSRATPSGPNSRSASCWACRQAGPPAPESLARGGQAEGLGHRPVRGRNGLQPTLSPHPFHIAAQGGRIQSQDLADPRRPGQAQLADDHQDVELAGLDAQRTKSVIIQAGDDPVHQPQASAHAILDDMLDDLLVLLVIDEPPIARCLNTLVYANSPPVKRDCSFSPAGHFLARGLAARPERPRRNERIMEHGKREGARLATPGLLLTCSPAPCSPAPLLPCSPAHLLTCSPAHLLTCSPAHLLTCSPAHLLTCSPAPCYLLTCSPAPCSPAPLLPCSPAPLLTCSPAHLCSPAPLLTCSPAHLLPCSPSPVLR